MAKTFVIAMKETFIREGEGLGEFVQELKQLTPQDKEWFYKELVKSGVDCQPPAGN